MRLPRLFIDIPLAVNQRIYLPSEASHYTAHVLRLRVNDSFILFNGQSGEYQAKIIAITKKNVEIQIDEFYNIEKESPLQLTLVQAISRPEHMDYALQKSVELGVHHIVPVLTERSPPLDKNRLEKREQHWQKIIISACEQCGRNRLPTLSPIQSLMQWLAIDSPVENRIVLSPQSQLNLPQAIIKNSQQLTILVGAEGGLTIQEIQQASLANYTEVSLGPRILRTETAAIAILALCQGLWGDL